MAEEQSIDDIFTFCIFESDLTPFNRRNLQDILQLFAPLVIVCSTYMSALDELLLSL